MIASGNFLIPSFFSAFILMLGFCCKEELPFLFVFISMNSWILILFNGL